MDKLGIFHANQTLCVLIYIRIKSTIFYANQTLCVLIYIRIKGEVGTVNHL